MKQLGELQWEEKRAMALRGIEPATPWVLLQWGMVPLPVRERLSSAIPRRKRSREVR